MNDVAAKKCRTCVTLVVPIRGLPPLACGEKSDTIACQLWYSFTTR